MTTPRRLPLPPALLALWALLVVLALATRSFAPVDETRYLAVAWHMWRRGDFLLPWLAGEPYAHKPPLMFWLMHAGWALTGVNEWWPRLISPLAALAALVLTSRLARALWPGDAGVGDRAAWLLAGSALWVIYTTATMFDLLLTAFVLLGISGLVEAAQGRARRGWSLLALGLAGGLLSKGPVILLHLLPAALLVRVWAPPAARTGGRWAPGLIAALAAGALLALAWAVPAGVRGGEVYRDAIFWGQTAGRLVQAFDHARPWWWYLPLLPLLVFPWMFWPPAWRAARTLARGPRDAGMRLALAWGLPAFLLLSATSGKQVHYLLPLFPAAALVLACGLGRAGPVRRFDAVWVALPGAAIGAALLGLAAWRPASTLAPWLAALPPWLAMVPLVWAAGLVAVTWRRRGVGPMAAGAALLPAGLAALLFVAAGPAYDTRPTGERLGALQAAGRPLARLAGEDQASFDFTARLARPLQPVARAELGAWFGRHPDGVVLLEVGRAEFDPARPALHAQPLRGHHVVLADAQQWRAWLRSP